MTKKRLGNKGFSLLELLIGITMLAIIVVPVMHAFVTSASTSNKAREVRNQTLAAQNILESYEATDISAVIGNIKGRVTPFGSIAASASVFAETSTGVYTQVTDISTEATDGPRYKIYLKNVTVNNKSYDAVLNIDATVKKYENLNKAGIVDYKPMDAVYIQPEPLDVSNPDVIAAKDSASQALIDFGYVVPLDHMTRTVTITIQKIGDQTGVISCTALFRYDAYYTDITTEPPVTKVYSVEVNNDFYSGSYSASENGLLGLYFFFYPNISGDAIDVVNSDNIDMSVYLIRQSADTGTYNPVIKLMEKALDDNKPSAQMYYNKASYQYRYYIGHGDDVLSYFWYKTLLFDGNLIGTPAQNRLYGVTVDLYKAESIQGDSVSGPILATFDASSLE